MNSQDFKILNKYGKKNIIYLLNSETEINIMLYYIILKLELIV